MMPLRILSRLFALLGLLLVLPQFSGCAATAPSAKLWDRWTAHDELDRHPSDAAAWAEFLQRYAAPDAQGVTRLAYAKVTAADKARLDGWIRLQQQQPVSRLALREQRAYWLNLYNAGVVALVLSNPGIGSTAELEPSWWTRTLLRRKGPYAQARFSIEGQSLSLDDIENHILRPRWRDARTDYALCKATLGGPPLAATPYAGEHLDEQLEAQAQAWINGPHALRFAADGSLQVAVLYRRYRGDFGDDAAVLAELRRRATGPAAQKLARTTKIAGTFDDPALNAAR